MGAEFFYPDGQTDGQTWVANNRFSQFCYRI